MTFMSERKQLRLTEQLDEDIETIVRNNPETYFNYSHFVRVALIREVRRAKDEEKKHQLRSKKEQSETNGMGKRT